MREIKFRGLSVWSNKWVYGTGAHNGKGNKNYINTPGGMIQTHEGSNGQFTGFKERNGTEELYDGDIMDNECVVRYDIPQGKWKAVPFLAVKINAGLGGWTGYDLHSHRGKKIGNIFENSDLLESSAQ